MSLDYPFYQELRRRRHAGANWWIVGDRLYFIGLLAAVISLVVTPWFGIRAIAASAAGMATFFVGACCKRHSYLLGAKDGINVDEY